MKVASRYIVVIALSIVLTFPAIPVGEAKYDASYYDQEYQARTDDPIFERIVDVPPGSETRICIDENGMATVEGIGNNYDFVHGRLGEAATRVPSWLREAFVDNMLKAGSAPIQGIWVIPTFGDIDGDGDDDMAVGIDGVLHFYENVGSDWNPIYQKMGWDPNDSEDTLDFDGQFCSPCLADFDNDTYIDLIVGETTELSFFRNPRSDMGSYGSGLNVNDDMNYASPMVYARTYDSGVCNMTLIWGTREGLIKIMDFQFQNGYIETYSDIPSTLRWFDRMATYTSPRPWLYHDSEADHVGEYIAIGSGEGIIRLYERTGSTTDPYQEVDGYFFNDAQNGRVTPICQDLDGDHEGDLVLGTQGAGVREFINYADAQNPDWRTDYEDPIAQAAGYVSAFDKQIMVYDESMVSEYLDSIIRPIDKRYRDEIAFACAYTPAGQMRNNSLATLFQENAKLIYERDGDLGYVVLEEKEDHTTATYNVRSGDGTMKLTLPRDIYYWGIVHPRVTEEPVGYVDPNSGQISNPSSGGRFWREYLWTTADSEYPPGPDYPANWTGPKAYYPRDYPPPLLSHDASEAEFLWDLQPYEYPAGFDNAGKVDNYPKVFKDHGIEKVSQWVEKTLVLNQQESPENERPNQPVRIAHGHNGNCGELQDLTIAAARTALIPARGILLTGEDHVWSEFYAGGWHQWDNYWSDAGGVIADQMNYWWGWGSRGGSGIMSVMGDGSVADEGGRYLPPDVTGKLQVHVTDNNGLPVDGARVMVFSHWIMQQTSISVGPYQGPPPVTAPLPSIWGYTDMDGNVEFRVCHQDINIQVISDLGTYMSQKFKIDDTETRKIEVGLNSNMPVDDILTTDDFYGAYGQFFASMQVVSSYQEQGSFVSNDISMQPVLNSYIWSYNQAENYYKGYANEKIVRDGVTLQELLHMGELILRNNASIKTTVRVLVRIFSISSTDVDEGPLLFPTNPKGLERNGSISGTPSFLGGFFYDQYSERNKEGTYYSGIDLMSNFRLVSDEEIYPIEIDHRPNHSYMFWYAAGVIGPPGWNHFLFQADVDTQNGMKTLNISYDVLFKDVIQPCWAGYTGSGERAWGSTFTFGATYADKGELLSSIGWVDDGLVWSLDHLNKTAQGTVDSRAFGSGHHRLRITCWDDAQNIATLSFNVNFTATPPILTITSPIQGDSYIDGTIPIAGSVSDDVMLSAFILRLLDREYDLMPEINDDGSFLSSVEIGPEPGNYTLFFDAIDNVGQITHIWNDITLLPPLDLTPPNIEISDPLENERIYIGETITVRGIAEDDRGVVSLKALTPGGMTDLIRAYEGYSWQFKADTSKWPAGNDFITVEASDPSGNKYSVVRTVFLQSRDKTVEDTKPPVIQILSPALGTNVDIAGVMRIEGAVTDDSGMALLWVSWDGVDSYIPAEVGSGGRFVCSHPSSDLISGAGRDPSVLREFMSGYTVRFRAEDLSGNEETVSANYPISDTIAPEILFLQAKASTGSSRIIIQLLVNDSSTIEKAVWRLEDGDGGQVSQGVLSFNDLTSEPEGFSAAWEIVVQEPGDYKVIVAAYDPFANEAEERSSVSVQKEKNGSGPNYLIIVPSLLVILLFLALLVYRAVRLGRRT